MFSMLCVPERTMQEYDFATLDFVVYPSPRVQHVVCAWKDHGGI